MKVIYYVVSYCNESADENPRREWYQIADTSFRSNAIKIAKEQSKKHYEIEIRGFDKYGDICFHQYYRNGKLFYDMNL